MPSFGSLRVRLLLLVVFALLPALGLLLYSAAEQRRLSRAAVREEVRRLVDLAARQQEQVIEAAQHLLGALSELPAVRQRDGDTCRDHFVGLRRAFPRYANVVAAAPDGTVFCSALAVTDAVTVADRAYFRQALERRTFAIGEVQIGRITRRPVVPFAQPVVVKGAVQAVIVAALDLRWLNESRAPYALPAGAALMLVDAEGRLLVRRPHPEVWVGRQVPEVPSVRAAVASTDGAIEMAGVDGIRRVYAFERLAPPGEQLLMAVGISPELAYAAVDRSLMRNLATLGGVAALALVAAWIGGNALIVRRLHALSRAAERIEAGDYCARSGLSGGRDELAGLARAFDGMADSLEREQLFRQTIFERMNEAVIACDRSGRVVLLNQEARGWCGLEGAAGVEDVDEASAAVVFDAFPIGEALAGERFHQRELLVNLPRQSPRAVLASGGPLVTADGHQLGAFVTAHDITERKLALETIRRLNLELEDRVRERTLALEVANRELEAFSYSVSHDLRAPLRALDGFSQALLEDYHDRLDEDGRDFLRRIRTASQHMGQLIDDLLKLSRVSRTPLAREAVDLTAVAGAVVAALRRADPARAVDVDIQAGMVAVADRRLLAIALENLLGNAWKFTSGRADARIALRVAETDAGPVYCIEDNGAGFDMKYADKLFGAFQRLHTASEFPGTGIGLATVQRIVHRHGGRIWADAAIGHGARFCLTLGEGNRGVKEVS